jgi:hypothetical protein
METRYTAIKNNHIIAETYFDRSYDSEECIMAESELIWGEAFINGDIETIAYGWVGDCFLMYTTIGKIKFVPNLK